jgi:hypothetical protein
MVATLMLLVLWPIAYVLQVLLVGVFLRFHLNTAVRYLHGRGMGDALGLDRGPPAPAREPDGSLQSAVTPAEPSTWRDVDSPDGADGSPRAGIPEPDDDPATRGRHEDSPGTEGLEAPDEDPMSEEFR